MPLELIPCLIGLFPITSNTHRPEVVYVICPASGDWSSVINLPSIRLMVSTVIVTCQSLTATAAFSASFPENRAQFSLGVHISSFLLLDYVDRQGTVEHGELNSFRRRFGFAPLFRAPARSLDMVTRRLRFKGGSSWHILACGHAACLTG